jgi:hypothetical protein
MALASFSGWYFLAGLALPPPGEAVQWPPYRGRATNLAVLDRRTTPGDRTVNVMIGLVEARRMDLIPTEVSYSEVGQIIVLTQANPWVWIVVSRQSDDELRKLSAMEEP